MMGVDLFQKNLERGIIEIAPLLICVVVLWMTLLSF